jgi:hypothetical protein
MEREDEDGKQFAGMCFHSPHRDGRYYETFDLSEESAVSTACT